MRKLIGVGSPRSLQGRLAAFLLLLLALLRRALAAVSSATSTTTPSRAQSSWPSTARDGGYESTAAVFELAFTTGC
jgi:hypothetical protein